jgi:murein DD-endopeptidase MepM/ murein hydrolase activator NlpD
MVNKKLFAKVRILLSVALALFSMGAYSATSVVAPESRPEVTYVHQHSFSLGETGLFADGIRLRLDLSVLEEAEITREFDTSVIPADELHGGMWPNRFVNAYGNRLTPPDSFVVDLSSFTMPIETRMTSNFGWRGRRFHYGVDLQARTGDTIVAAFDGKIRVRQFQRGGYGYFLVVRHPNGLETVYAHLSRFLVEENEFVRSGQPIGLAGSTGRSTGPHLHFETRFMGRPVNPNFLIDFQNKVAHRDEFVLTQANLGRTNNRSTVPRTGPINVQIGTTTNAFVAGEVQHHRIQQGDTLSAIARRYGTTVRRLTELNNITPTTVLRVGRTIRIS